MMTAYDITMRTVIDLPSAQVEALTEICRRERISRAEAIRRAVGAYLKAGAGDAAAEAFGLWAPRRIDALQYERGLRDEWEHACEPSSIPTS